MSGQFGQFGFPTIGSGGGGGGGDGCLIDADTFIGADAGAKIQAAIDSLPSYGGVVDCRCLTGTQAISSTITVDKPVQLLFGASTFVCTASPSIYVTQGAQTGDGSIIQGAGPDVTIFQAAGGVTPIFRVEGYDVKVLDLQVKYTSPNASNCAIQVQNGANTNVLRPHLDNLNLDGGGNFTSATGDGVTFSICFVGTVFRCFIHGFANGIRTKDDGINSSTAIMIQSSRIHDNSNAGIQYDNVGDGYVFGNTIEGNGVYGIWMKKGFYLCSRGNHYEQVGGIGGALANVKIEGITDAFARSMTFLGDLLSGTSGGNQDIILGAGTTQSIDVRGGQCGSGISIGAGQPTAIVDIIGGSGNTGSFSTRTGDSWKGNGVLTLSFPTWGRVSFDNELTNTLAGSIEYLTAIQDLNPAANSASTFLGFEAVTRIKNGNTKNFTGIISGATITGDHLGTGLATQLRGLTVTVDLGNVASQATTIIAVAAQVSDFSNSATHVTDAIGFYVPVPINAGTQVIDTYTGVYVTDANAVAHITNKFAIQTAGGSLKFVLAHTGDVLNVLTPASLNAFTVSATTDTIGIGIAPDATTKVEIFQAWTALTAFTNETSILQLNPSANTSAGFSNIAGSMFVDAANTKNLSGTLVGMSQTLDHRGSGVVTSMWGIQSSVIGTGTGNISDVQALYASVSNFSTGVMASAIGLHITAPNNFGGGSITTWYGILIDTPTAAGTNYSLYISGGTTVINAFQTAAGIFWVAGNATTYLLYCQASTSRIGIGTNAPQDVLHVTGGGVLIGGTTAGFAGTVGYTNVVDNSANGIGVGSIFMKGSTSRSSSGFIKILDGTTPRYIPYFDAITG